MHHLQANLAGAWKHVAALQPDQVDAVVEQLRPLARLLGKRPKWRIVDERDHVMADDTTIRNDSVWLPDD